MFKIKDFDKAEEYVIMALLLCFSTLSFLILIDSPRYCNRVYLQSDDAISSSTSRPPSASKTGDPLPSIYHTLLSLYLTPQPPHEPNWAPALDLLSKHGSRLPASNTLTLIPTTLPVKDLENYFRGRIRAANSIVNEARVVAGLRKSEVVRAQSSLLLGDEEGGGERAESTSSFNAAGTGGSRNRHVVIGEERVCGVCHKRLGRSVVSVLPDNTVVHYACSKRAVQRVSKPGEGLGILERNVGSKSRSAGTAIL